MKKISSITHINQIFFIGIAGTGMSAIAQYFAGIGKTVSGSDRCFETGESADVKAKLEAANIKCYFQNGDGIKEATELVVVSTAIEDTVAEVQKARQMEIPIIKRSELLALIAATKKTIAIGGTSGKSTTSAMLFDIMEAYGMHPGIISGAGLVSLIKQNKIGNAKVGTGDWLIIEADESDGSIVQYKPEIGVLLNIDKDHQEVSELISIFGQFKKNTKEIFITNRSNPLANSLSINNQHDFGGETGEGYAATDFHQEGLMISFNVQGVPFTLHTIGKHNMENALAAIAVANLLGVPLPDCASALKNYEGIYRRHQLLGIKDGVYVIDDYAHNPVKCASSINACQAIAPKVVAWFQPHGYGPTRFLKNDFIEQIADVLRPGDEIWMSEIYYAGGTAIKDISANDLITGIQSLGKNAFFVEKRENFLEKVRQHLIKDCVLLLMGARDQGLETFSKSVWKDL